MLLVRIGKLLLGVALLPACVVATMTFRGSVFPVFRSEIYFFAGLFSYLLLLAIFQQPVRTYIFGHELTHVMWVWLFGGKVKGFKAKASGGQVRASRSNSLIFLAPYFFPLYSILAIALYYLLGLFWEIPYGLRILGFVLGFTWAFHITFTIYVLLQGQPDVWAAGRIFSFPFIYLVNVLVLAALLILLSSQANYDRFFPRLWAETGRVYKHLWTTGPGFCRSVFETCRLKVAAVL